MVFSKIPENGEYENSGLTNLNFTHNPLFFNDLNFVLKSKNFQEQNHMPIGFK